MRRYSARQRQLVTHARNLASSKAGGVTGGDVFDDPGLKENSDGNLRDGDLLFWPLGAMSRAPERSTCSPVTWGLVAV